MCRRNLGDLTARRLKRRGLGGESKKLPASATIPVVIRVTRALPPLPFPLPPAALGLVSICPKTGMKRR